VNNPQASAIWAKYQDTGAITNLNGRVAFDDDPAAVNTNAAWDAARRASKIVRWISRRNIVAYAVENEVSVVWVDRYAWGMGNATPVDLLEGIAPSFKPVASGSLVYGRRYRVAAGSVTYAGQAYLAGSQFTAGVVSTFTASRDAKLLEAEGIRAAAEPGGVTNEWLLGMELMPLNPSNSSIWKAEAFADIIGPFNRCLFCDDATASDLNVLNHIAFGIGLSGPFATLQPEAPDAFNFIPTPNSVAHKLRANQGASADFYSSCRLFEPWPEITSAVADPSMGANVVKLTLGRRFHHHPDAPIAISNDLATWDLPHLRAEVYRTWENGIREWLAFGRYGILPSTKIGDQAVANNCAGMGDAPWPCVLPRIYLVKQIPRPHPGAGVIDPSDTPLWHDAMGQMDLTLGAICHAFVDGQTSAALACSDSATDVYGFTFETLMHQASGGRWISPVAWSTTPSLGPNDIAASRPEGCGPLPGCIVAAQVHNQFAAAINLLDTFRVMIPAELQFRTAINSADSPVITVQNGVGQAVPPNSDSVGRGGTYAVWTAQPGPPVSDGAWTDWAGGSYGDASITVQLNPGYILSTRRISVQYRWSPDADAVHALPDEFVGMLENVPTIYGQITDDDRTYTSSMSPGAFTGTQCNPGTGPDSIWSDGLGDGRTWTENTAVTNTCGKLTGGVITPKGWPHGPVWASASTDGHSTCNGDPQVERTITVTNTTTPTITVPLIDPPDAKVWFEDTPEFLTFEDGTPVLVP
jgi:hypothetical protein